MIIEIEDTTLENIKLMLLHAEKLNLKARFIDDSPDELFQDKYNEDVLTALIKLNRQGKYIAIDEAHERMNN